MYGICGVIGGDKERELQRVHAGLLGLELLILGPLAGPRCRSCPAAARSVAVGESVGGLR